MQNTLKYVGTKILAVLQYCQRKFLEIFKKSNYNAI